MPRFKVGIKRFIKEVELPRGYIVIKVDRHEFLDSKGEVRTRYEIIYLEPAE